MVVFQHHSLDTFCQLKQQGKIADIESKWQSNLGDCMTTVFPDIESVPTPGGLSEWNVEQIVEPNSDVVIAASQAPEDAMSQIMRYSLPSPTYA